MAVCARCAAYMLSLNQTCHRTSKAIAAFMISALCVAKYTADHTGKLTKKKTVAGLQTPGTSSRHEKCTEP